MKTMNDAMHTVRNYPARLTALFLALFMLIGAASFLAITSPPTQAAELDNEPAPAVIEEPAPASEDDVMLPAPMNRAESAANQPEVTIADTINYDSADESDVWFKSDASDETAPAQAKSDHKAPEQAAVPIEPEVSQLEQEVAAPEPVAAEPEPQPPTTLRIMGEDIPYIYSYNVVSAPSKGCGIWKGVDDVNDGEYTYFVGHNPGDFYNVMNLREGNVVTLKDASGASRDYTVHHVYTVAQRTTYAQIAEMVEGYGESVVMQTCCGDNVNVRIVVAY